VVHSGPYATLTWASNGFGLLLAILLVVLEWVARGHATALAGPRGANAPVH